MGYIGGLPARMSYDGKIDYYDRMHGFVENKTGSVIDFMEYFQNKVYALDSQGNNLIVFDLENYECRYIPLNCSHQSWINFVALERYGSDYYIFPKYENKILVFDTAKNKIREIKNYLDCSGEIQCVCRVNDDVWILPKDMDIIYCYHLKNGKKKEYGLKKRIEDCIHAFFDGMYIYFLNMYGIIYIWDIDEAELREITVFETEHSEKETMSKIIYAGNRLILLPAYGKDIKILELLTEKTEIYDDYPEDFLFQPNNYKFYGYCENKKYYFFAQCFGNYFLKIDKQSGQLMWVKSKIDLLGKRAIELLENQVIYEDVIEITDLLKVYLPDTFQVKGISAGKEIYYSMKE